MAKIYYQWMENIRDWCISRQLWWLSYPGMDMRGMRSHNCFLKKIPHCENVEALASNRTRTFLIRGSAALCGLFPLSRVARENRRTQLFLSYILIGIAFDIIFFWVARMIMMGLEFMENEPFKEVYIHALIRDEEGQKMSKSKGTS